MKMPNRRYAWKVRPFEQDYIVEDWRENPVFRPCGDTPEERKDVADTICETMNGAEWALFLCGRNATLANYWMHECFNVRDLVKRMAEQLKIHRGIFTGSGVWSETKQNTTTELIDEAKMFLDACDNGGTMEAHGRDGDAPPPAPCAPAPSVVSSSPNNEKS